MGADLRERAEGLAGAGGMRARIVGSHSSTATKNTTTNIDWKIPQLQYLGADKKMYFDGVQYKAYDGHRKDRIKFQVIDIDNILGYGANFVVEEFADINVIPDVVIKEKLYKAQLVKDLYLRLVYTSHAEATQDAYVVANLYRHLSQYEDL